MKIYENIEAERDRIQACISKFGWTSDHNLDWFVDAGFSETSKPIFVEFTDDTGLLIHDYGKEWWIGSDPLCDKKSVGDKISEASYHAFKNGVKEIWCVDVSDNIRPALIKKDILNVGNIYYSLSWPIMDMTLYDPLLLGGHFKDIRNAKNKFYREHKIQVVNTNKINKKDLHRIINDWKKTISSKQNEEDIHDLKYHNAIENSFKGFLTARVLTVDGKPVGFNAGYEVVNYPGRFAGVIGIHDYSINDLGLILWLEDLEWIKHAGYQELDMQGDEDGGLKFKMQFGPAIERKSDTFSIKK